MSSFTREAAEAVNQAQHPAHGRGGGPGPLPQEVADDRQQGVTLLGSAGVQVLSDVTSSLLDINRH